MSESGELTELGRAYIPPKNFLESLHAICSAAAQWNDSAQAQKLALDVLVIAHHPSVGEPDNNTQSKNMHVLH